MKARNAWQRLAALVVVLLLVQSAAFTHFDADDSHATDSVCAFCVGLSSLSGGNVSASPEVAEQAKSGQATEFVGFLAAAVRFDHQYARGPPQAS